MESAALLVLVLKMGLASSMGVVFGWQPMPDGSPKYEYLVQIEPELAATLQEGQTIPITSDIPEEIGPIGRIRIVIGRGDLPRQQLVTQLKPWPKQTSDEGLVETQFTVPPVEPSGSERYGNTAATNNAILPPSDHGATTTQPLGNPQGNPFGRALQQGAQEARNLAAEGKQQILPPTGNQLFGESSVGSQGVQNAIDNAADRLQRGFERGVERVADRTDQQFRQAADNAGRGAQNAADRFGRAGSSERSILKNGSSQSSATILPPGGQTNSDPNTTKSRQNDQPILPFNQQQPSPQPISPPANFAESSPVGTNPASQPPAPWKPVPSGHDGFGLANRSSENDAPRYPTNNQPEFKPTTVGTNGPGFSAIGSQQPSQPAADYRRSNPPATPEIRRDMIGNPDGNDLRTVSSSPGSQAQTAAGQLPDSQDPNAQTRDFGWNKNNSNTANPNIANPNIANNEETDPKNSNTVFPLLLSWVLLSGSGVGNVYLFWSYLDVRHKYQDMVHDSPRRRDRYDD